MLKQGIVNRVRQGQVAKLKTRPQAGTLGSGTIFGSGLFTR
jgi:hypothetical protein